MIGGRVLVVFVAAAVLVACDNSDRAAVAPTPSTKPEPTTVTTGPTTTTTGAPLPPGPPCVAANLQGQYEDYISAMNQPSYFFTLINTGARCTLHGYPGVQIVDSGGKPVGTSVERGGGFTTHDPGPRDVTLSTGSKAWFTIASTGICPQGSATPDAAVSSAVLIIPPNARRQIKIPARMSYCPQGRTSVSAVASDRDAFGL